MNLSEFWRRVAEILLLLSPIFFLLFGINLEELVSLIDALIIAIGPVILILKNIYDLIRGWLGARKEGLTGAEFRALSPAKFSALLHGA